MADQTGIAGQQQFCTPLSHSCSPGAGAGSVATEKPAPAGLAAAARLVMRLDRGRGYACP